MKKTTKTALSLFLFASTLLTKAQEISTNLLKNPCITTEQYDILDKEIAENLSRLPAKKMHSSNATPSLIWPIRQAKGFNDCGYHYIGAYVDHNKTAGAISDFNCGTNTYDSHQGTDIAVGPYGFVKMENNHVEVVAAAAGTIVQKADGNFDRNCAKNTTPANSIIIQHADGSQTLYWHMKKNSVTSKIVGDTVEAGEYLGVVGSSGSSSGPHLHFEVRSGSTSATYQDPFSGTCNTLNAKSWWANQKPHSDPAVLKVSVNTTDLVMPGCPTTETPNESDSFLIPFQGAGLPAGFAKFYVFLRDATAGSSVDLKILNPDGSTFTSWTYNVASALKSSYAGWSKKLPLSEGKYTFQSTYNNVICSKSFDIVTSLLGLSTLSENEAESFAISPNPATTSFNLSAENIENGMYSFTIQNISGQIVVSEDGLVENNLIHKNFSVANVANGLYFLIIENAKTKVVKKIIIQ